MEKLRSNDPVTVSAKMLREEVEKYLRKPPKLGLVKVHKTYLPEVPPEVSSAEIPSALIIDFVAYCRKVPLRKLLLKTYGDLVRHLWATFRGLLFYT